jgi:polyisoprenyl-phosphate glycosyltransferase
VQRGVWQSLGTEGRHKKMVDRRQPVAVVTPVFNDWEAFGLLLEDLGKQKAADRFLIHVFAVDDGSTTCPTADAFTSRLGNIERLHIMRLTGNLGHQRAIAVGLVAAFKVSGFTAVVVMDCDGEDRPMDVFQLLEKAKEYPGSIIVAKRAQRSESIVLRAMYRLYKALFRALTGQSITFGNFCLIPTPALQALVHNPAIWNHLAAAIKRSKTDFVEIPIDRGPRLRGISRMNFVSLALHGIGAISVYTDVVFVRIIMAAGITGLVVLLCLGGIFGIRLGTDWAIPGWATYVTASLTIIFLQALLFASIALFQLLSLRSMRPFIPITDARVFLSEDYPSVQLHANVKDGGERSGIRAQN